MCVEQVKNWVKSCWQGIVVSEEKDELMDNIIQAKEEWEQAKHFFQEAVEPEIIDYAIYRLDAAERKYMYLLDQAREREEKNSTNQSERSC